MNTTPSPLYIMLLGKDGQIGWELQQSLAPLGQVVALGRAELDLTDTAAIRAAVRAVRPHLIVNAAAYTAVDRAEAEPELAHAINATAPGVLAEEASRLGAALLHYSTDYVFDGSKRTPYTENDQPHPLNAYGMSKLAGERAIQAVGAPHIILRTSWVYGLRGHNFLLTILRLARQRPELRIVDDQHGAPTWSRAVAQATAALIAQDPQFTRLDSGIYHLTAAGQTTWFGFAQAILDLDPHPSQQLCTRLIPIPSHEYPTPARRPMYSVLSNDKIQSACDIVLPDWHHSLAAAFRSAP